MVMIDRHPERTDVLIVRLTHSINTIAPTPWLEDCQHHIDQGVRLLIVDADQLDYLSSFGLGIILRLHQRMQLANGCLRLCSLKAHIHEMLKVTQLTHVFDIHPNLSDALTAQSPSLTE
ncbi:MAG: hypothetical protein HJJLKODD_01487 [Phycisphaerae bacterium]|nr:hypothetical protein [Phycisphaerae bacterium]